jgi:pimeloyl-ACP methyl ester carboxylesterase
MTEGFVATTDGRVHYVEAGSGAPLILLHSVGSSVYEFEDVMEALSAHQRVIAWDMPGHGDSDPLPRHYTIDDYAGAVVRLMDALNIERASVLGESIGGPICAALGADHADRIERLIFCESPLRTEAEWAANWARVEGNFGIPESTLEQLQSRLRAPTAAFVTRWNIDRNKAGAQRMVDAMWAIREYDIYAALPRVRAPSLALFGAKGAFVPAGKDVELAQLANHADLVVLPESGHFPMVDEPEAFASAVNAFVAQEAAV